MTLEYLEIMEMRTNEMPAKVPRKVRGTMTIKALDDMEFRADRCSGESSQELIASDGQSKLYRTVGEKKQSTVVHIVAPADCCDLRAYFYDKVESLTKGMESKAKPRLKGITLMNDDDLRVVFSKKERTIEATLRIELESTPAYNNRLITLMQRLSQCFAINQTTFHKQRR